MKENGILSSHDGNGIHPEELLNVLRESDELVLGTGTIADEVGMTKEGVRPHLEEFREEGRVIYQEIGGNHVWGLDPGEPQKPIPPEFDRFAHFTQGLQRVFEDTKFVGTGFMLLGAAIMLIGITEPLAAILSPWISAGQLVILGAGIAATGGFSWFLGGGLISMTKLLERVVKFQSDNRGSLILSNGERTSDRGESLSWYIVSGLILVVIAPVLFKIGVETYSAFAATAAFGPIGAFLIAVLLVGGIALGILEAG